MTDRKEILRLAARMEDRGADVTINYDREGYIDTVQISRAKGIGPFPMGMISAAERMREFLAR